MSKHLLLSFCSSLMVLLGCATEVSAQIPTQNLVAHYPFNGNTVDASGNGNDAVNVNATLIEDRYGAANAAYQFNGEDAYLDIANDFDYPERTINLWFYIDSIDMHGAIYDTDHPGLTYGHTKIFVTETDGMDTLEAAISIPHDQRPITRGVWHMITIVRTDVRTQTFLNCEPMDTRDNSENSSVDGVTGTRIGTTRLFDRFFEGRVDDIRIYDATLDEEDIRELLREGNPNIKTNAPAICPTDNAVMTPNCADACVVCDIDGFTGRNVADDFGELPPGFAGDCTINQHKAAWIAFIAGSTNLKIQMEVDNCTTGSGLELGIYAGDECGDFRRISNCHGGATRSPISVGNPRELEVFEELEIGQYYYIVMDATPRGTEFETCDWTLTVLEGSTEILPLNTSGTIIGSQSTCTDLTNSYHTGIGPGATDFIWTVNGVDQGINNDSIDITFPRIGSYIVCVQANNACQFPEPSCQEILVEPIHVTSIDTMVCESDCVVVADTMICDPGFYTRRFVQSNGCDSLVEINFMNIPTPIVDVDLNICEGDTFYIGDTPYFTTGNHQERLMTVDRCDSIVNLDLFVVVCNIQSTSTPRSVSCHGGSDGSITFEVDQGTAPFTYAWERIGGTEQGTGNITALGEENMITNLIPGVYAINIDDGFGNMDIIIETITEPEPLLVTLITSDYNGQNISCPLAEDGTISVMATGGAGSYQYDWSDGDTGVDRDSLDGVMYTVSVKDALGCIVPASVILSEPMPISYSQDPSNPSCDGPSSGQLAIDLPIGGVAPYMYSLDQANWQSDPVFQNLGADDYTSYVRDANECISQMSFSLTAPEIPIVQFQSDYQIALGDSVQFSGTTNALTDPVVTWTPTEFLSCTDCLDPYARPPGSLTYEVVVTSQDGCTDRDSINIDVQKFRRFYAPTAFTPNQDGINDLFNIEGGPEVAFIESLQIFDRWGGLVYNDTDLSLSNFTTGWDGRKNGENLNAGVYVWFASIRFIDNEVIEYTGDFVLIR